jgi:hypothetical protein
MGHERRLVGDRGSERASARKGRGEKDRQIVKHVCTDQIEESEMISEVSEVYARGIRNPMNEELLSKVRANKSALVAKLNAEKAEEIALEVEGVYLAILNRARKESTEAQCAEHEASCN